MNAGADDLSAAMRLLRVGSTDERLSAARLLRGWAGPAEVDQLRRARRRELDHYVKIAIDDALASASSRQRAGRWRSAASPPVPHADALEAATATVLHEIRPILALARLAADRRDLALTTARLDQMHRTLLALEDIARVSDGSGSETFDLGHLIRRVVLDCDVPVGCRIDVHPESPLPVHGRAGAVSLIVRNGLVNALEATAEAELPPGTAVTIAYGCTHRPAWVSIMDQGDGVAANLQPFDRGATQKPGHDGIGLALARVATESLAGSLTLTNLAERGAQLRLEWPQPVETS